MIGHRRNAVLRAVVPGRVAGTNRTTHLIPEYAQALLRGWAGRSLLPQEWACDVTATYLTLRLEMAERHTGVPLLDPTLPLLPPVAWHERHDPEVQELAELTKSPWLCRQ
jgi:hypothetical protein